LDYRSRLGSKLTSEMFYYRVIAKSALGNCLIEHPMKARFRHLEAEHFTSQNADVLTEGFDGRSLGHRNPSGTAELPCARLRYLLQDYRRMGGNYGHSISLNE